MLFSPHSGLVPNSASDYHFARLIGSRGEDLLRVSCSGQLSSWCPVINAVAGAHERSDQQIKNICRACVNSQPKGRADFFEKSVDLKQLLLANDLRKAEELVGEVTTRNWADFYFNDLPLGKWATYNAMIDFKAELPSQDDKVFNRYLRYLKSAVLASTAARRIHERYRIKGAAGQAFEYSDVRAFLGTLEKLGVDTHSFDSDGPRGQEGRSLVVFRAHRLPDIAADSRYRRGLSDPLSLEEAEIIHSHLESAVLSNSYKDFSPTKSGGVPDYFMNDDKREVVLVLTSSPDEIRASKTAQLRPDSMMHDDDLVFIQNVLELAAKNPDLRFLIRVHPRLASSERLKIDSFQLEKIKEIANSDAPNVDWDFPEQNVSLHDIIPHCSFAITYRSSSAWEAMALGLRVFYTDTSKDPLIHRRSSQKQNASIEKRFTDFRREKSDSTILAWRFLATHLLRIRIPISATTEQPKDIRVAQASKKSLETLVKTMGPFLIKVAPGLSIRLNRLRHKSNYRFTEVQQSGTNDMVESSVFLEQMENYYSIRGASMSQEEESRTVLDLSSKLRRI